MIDPWEAFGEDGDGLLFACLLSVAQDKEFLVEAARGSDGRWYRNPIMALNGKISADGATISRDMFMGLLLYCLYFQRADILDQLWSYGWKNFWKMGDENAYHEFYGIKIKDNRTWFTPGLVALLGWIRAAVKGKFTFWKWFPQVYGAARGYPSHLTMLHLLANRALRGNSTSYERSILVKISEHMSMNPLVWVLLDDKVKALSLLNDIWPKGRLPTWQDWTEQWRLQRSDGDSGLTGDPGNSKQHTGGDYLFVIRAMELCRNV